MYKVMLVDDEEIILEGLYNVIRWEEYGFQIVKAVRNGKEAIDYLLKNRINLIITDIKMPLINGISLIKEVSKLYPHIKIIIISGYDIFEYAQKAMMYSTSYYILKPTKKEDLYNALTKARNELLKQETVNNSIKNSYNETKYISDKLNYHKKIIINTCKYLEKNYNKKITLNTMSKYFSISTSHFTHVFRKEKGISFGKYLMEYRFNKAKELLRNKDLKIYEVSYLIGYNDIHHFMKLFKKRYGISPGEYRKIVWR